MHVREQHILEVCLSKLAEILEEAGLGAGRREAPPGPEFDCAYQLPGQGSLFLIEVRVGENVTGKGRGADRGACSEGRPSRQPLQAAADGPGCLPAKPTTDTRQSVAALSHREMR